MSIANRNFHFNYLLTLCVALTAVAAGVSQKIHATQSSTTELEVIDQNGWPREIVTTRGVIVMYQPEPERLDALEQALFARTGTKGLVHHSDRGSQYLSIRYTERLAEAGYRVVGR